MIAVERLDAHDAGLLMAGGWRQAPPLGIPMCSAVVDESGSPLAFERMGGGKPRSIQIAIDEAFTRARGRDHATTAVAGFPERQAGLAEVIQVAILAGRHRVRKGI
ncbi:MAG: polymerase subunit delta [Bradyrhizobium sp.]|nr:polymerase subunit delta [Bradyrhizobium sp.]